MTGNTCNIFLVQEWQEVDWLCSAVSHLATKKGSIAHGICALKEFAMCVIQTISFPPFFSLESLGSWWLHIWILPSQLFHSSLSLSVLKSVL